MSHDLPKGRGYDVALRGLRSGSDFMKNTTKKRGLSSSALDLELLASACATTRNDTFWMAGTCHETCPFPIDGHDHHDLRRKMCFLRRHGCSLYLGSDIHGQELALDTCCA